VSDFSAYLAAAVLLGFVGYRFAMDRRAAPYPAQRYVYGFVFCEGLAMAMLAPTTPDLLTRVGAGGLTAVEIGEVVRTAAISFLMLIGCSVDPGPDPSASPSAPGPAPRSRLRARLPGTVAVAVSAAVAVQGAMVALFLAARPRMTADGSLAVDRAGRWPLSAHDALFAVYAFWCLAMLATALTRQARRLGPGPLRLGLRLTLAAAAVGMLWASWTVDDIGDVLTTGVQNGSEDTVSNVLGAVCAVLVVASATTAKWGDGLSAPLRWLRSYRTYLALEPLWEALRAEIPGIVLEERGPKLGARGPRPSAEFALYRRVIEIHDGRFALRPYAPARYAVAQQLARMSAAPEHDGLGALVEAASIATALENLRAGRKLEAPDAREAPLVPAASGTVAAEAAWLLKVTAAYTGSPVIPQVVDRLRESRGVS
jgi:hypothetical protein